VKPVKLQVATPKVAVGPESVQYLLHKEMAREQKHRGVWTLHASSVTKEDPEFCPREYALANGLRAEMKPEFIPTSLRWTFDTGWMLQDYVTRILRPYAWGDWRCTACGERFPSQWFPTWKCCERPHIEYKEKRFQSAISGIDCGIDLLIQFPGADLLTIVECKTIKADAFKTLVCPLPEHRTRTNLYMRLVDESKDPVKERVNVKEARVVYLCKGFGNKFLLPKSWKLRDHNMSPFREFPVLRNDEGTEIQHERGKQFYDWRNNCGPMPDRICPTQLCKRAQGCQFQGPCFKGVEVKPSE